MLSILTSYGVRVRRAGAHTLNQTVTCFVMYRFMWPPTVLYTSGWRWQAWVVKPVMYGG